MNLNSAIDRMIADTAVMSVLWDEAASAALRRDDDGFRKAMGQFHQRRAKYGNVFGIDE